MICEMEAIMPHDKMEELKEIAWDLLLNREESHMKALGVLLICEVDYWRQREELENDPRKGTHLRKVVPRKYSKGYELEIDDYIPHWLYAMRAFIPKKVKACIAEHWHYKPIRTKYLPTGHKTYQFD